MPDFPSVGGLDSLVSVSTGGIESMLGGLMWLRGSFFAANAWTTANTAIYTPVTLSSPLLAQKMAVDVTTQSGNLDVGIYSESGTRLVSKGSTAVAAAGVQVIDITDTWLAAGTYFIAMNCDTTAASFLGLSLVIGQSRACGCLQQAVGAVTLPSPATFATMAITRTVPSVLVAGVATI